MRNILQNVTDVRARRAASLRLSILLIFAGLIFGVVVVRLAQLQIRESESYRAEALNNSLRSIPVPPVRAAVVDRNGEILAIDVPQFRMVRILRNGMWETEMIDFETATRILEKGPEPGVYVEAVPRRTYPAGESMSHILGYVGEIGREEKINWEKQGYRSGDLIGKSGLERKYELNLTGERGRIILSVDSQGRFLDTFGSSPPRGAVTLKTTIDLNLQEAAYNALKEENRKGAIILMEPDTGDILAMATCPSFDNNLSIGGFDHAVWSQLQNDPTHPLINRAISVAVPLGSVFKLVVAAAAVEEGIDDGKTKYYCPGYYRLGRRTFRCWKENGHGRVNIEEGITHSCDVVFYTVGQQIGVANIKKYAKMLGLGRKVGIDLPGEAIGLLPDPEWKQSFRKSVWYEGDTVNLSIGQGFMQASPLQALVMTNVFATKGRLVTPRLWLGKEPEVTKVDLGPAAIGIVRRGMRGAVLKGTSVRMMTFPIPSAGKTGTADDPPREDPHAWYAGFIPYENPKLAFAVFVENGGHGSSDALPQVMKVLERALELNYFDGENVAVSSTDRPRRLRTEIERGLIE